MSSEIIAAALALIGFVITQGILKFVIEPIQEQRQIIGEVAYALLFFGNVSVDSNRGKHLSETSRLEGEMKKVQETQNALRALAGRLQSSIWTIPCYRVFAWCRVVPQQRDLLEASLQLVGWSNSLVGSPASDVIDQHREIISESLGIERKLTRRSWWKLLFGEA